MNKDNFFTKIQIESDINRVTTLMNSGIFNASVLRTFQESVFTEIMIKLNDLLQKLDKLKNRIDFKDDVIGDMDITDLISKIRNAVCHMDSGEHILENNKFTFNIAYGKGNILSINGVNITSDYDDDICFFFGENKIYLKRHILRVINEGNNKFKEIYKK